MRNISRFGRYLLLQYFIIFTTVTTDTKDKFWFLKKIKSVGSQIFDGKKPVVPVVVVVARISCCMIEEDVKLHFEKLVLG
jgi:hypothetical protein